MINGFLFREIVIPIGRSVRYHLFKLVGNKKDYEQLTSPENDDFWEKDLTQSIYNGITGITVLVIVILIFVSVFK